MKTERICTRVEPGLRQSLEEHAAAQRRPLSNLVALVLENYVASQTAVGTAQEAVRDAA